MNFFFRIIVLLLASSLAAPAFAAVTAALDRDQLSVGESVQLSLQRDGSASGKPDLAPLQQDFDVLGTSSGSSVQFINGHMSAQTQMTLTLSPKHAGKLRIPPISWDGEQSPALQLTVGNNNSGGHASGVAQGRSAHVFFTTMLDRKRPYVQGAVVLTVRLNTDQQLSQASLDLAGSNDILVEQLGKDRQYTDTRDGHRYQIVERQYLLQPQRGGTLQLEGPVLDAQLADQSSVDPFFGRVFGGLMNSTRPLRLHGEPIVLEVQPRPSSATGREWLPAQKVTLEETWRPDDNSAHAGEILTRHLRLSAEGLTAAQLPDLDALMSLPRGIKAYPDQAKLDTSLQDGKVIGKREQDIALIATEPGTYEIPALHISWWDTKNDAQREVTLPAQRLQVLPSIAANSVTPEKPLPDLASRAKSDSTEQIQPEQPIAVGTLTTVTTGLWPWISLGLCLLWLGTLALWWKLRIRLHAMTAIQKMKMDKPEKTSADRALKELGRACKSNDAKAARQCLLEWSWATWPEDRPHGPNALAERLGDPKISLLLQQLDRACYRGGDWNGGELEKAMNDVSITRSTVKRSTGLAELYP